jgi:hypothetical protein
MVIQIKNTTLERGNQFTTTREKLISTLKNLGWSKEDCTFREVKPEQLKKEYKSADGKNYKKVVRLN